MEKDDLLIWDRWIKTLTTIPSAWFFNVRVGLLDPDIADLPEREKTLAFKYTAFRIDAIAVRDFDIDLIEVRRSAKLGAVGSIIGYKTLWEIEPPFTGQVKMILVTDQRIASIQAITERLDIQYVVV